jgi:outer membrane protein
MPLPKDIPLLALALLPFAFSACRKEAPAAPPAAQAPPLPSPAAPLPPPSPAPAEPAPRLKIATVDMQQVFRDYHRTIALQKEQHADVARVQKDSEDRLTRIRELRTQIEALDKQLADPALSASRKQTLADERLAKTQDGIALDRERQEFLKLRHTALQEKSAEHARALLEEIRTCVIAKAKSEGLDYVFDKSATGPLQTAFFLHTPDAADMTGEIIAHLNRDAPAQEEAGNRTDTR